MAVGAVAIASGLAQQVEPVNIGVIQPLSGPVAASGNYVRMGTEIARDWINARGGVLGRPIQLLIEDNKSDPKEAASAAEKLIVRDKVPAIMGAWGSSMTLAVMPKLEEYGVPMVVETSSAASITRKGNPWVFRISPPSEMEAVGLQKYLGDLGIKKADFLAVNTDWGRGAVTAFGEILKRQGAGVGAVEFMDQAATDMSAQLTKIRGTGADTMFLTTSVEQITLVLKQAQEQRLVRKIISTGGSSSPDQLVKQAGAAAEGTYHLLFFLPWFPEAMPDGKLAQAFVDEWKRRGHPFQGLTEGFRGHDGVLTIVEAIRLAGKSEPKAIREALWKVNLMGVNGPIRFEKDGPPGKESAQSQPSIFVVQIKGGKVTLPAFMAKR
ncbi:MAG: ABC transporter substrate-binding protein [Candidatus Rokubacteria bacterium]|nr:ABC transporter substrate-binding protein [Candidatus Rokubacteria bacterium]